MRAQPGRGVHAYFTSIVAIILCVGVDFAGAYSGGTGTAADPYQIALPADWLELVGASADWGKQFVLTQDLDMAGIAMTPVAPYGTDKTTFSGTIDGRNHSIRNVTINKPNSSYVGLIGYADNRSTIRNLRLENIQVNGSTRVGGLAGYGAAILSNCHVTGAVSGVENVGGLIGWYYGNLLVPGPTQYGIMTYCSAAVMVSGTSEVGGLTGHDFGTRITSCYASGNVTGSTSVGGLMGYSQNSVISTCYAAGVINGSNSVGGLIGYAGSTFTACYSAGKVVGTGSNIGGLVGFSIGSSSSSCYWDIQTSGQTTSSKGVGKTTAEMKTRTTFPDDEWDFVGTGDMWGDWLMPEDGYPKLVWEVYPLATIPDMKGMTDSEARTMMADFGIVAGDSYETFDAASPIGRVTMTRPAIGAVVYSSFTKVDLFLARDRRFSGGSGTADDPYQIANPGDWKDLMENSTDWDKHFLVTGDMDLAKMDLLRVGTISTPFTGSVEGDNHVLHNITLEKKEASLGLFGTVGASGQIRNLKLENIYLNANYYLGGLAADNGGSIFGCVVTGFVRGTDSIGGLVGNNTGTIWNCQTTCKVNTWGRFKITGGLVGTNYGPILQSFSTGAVSGDQNVGGLVGINNSTGTIINCYATGEVNALTSKAGGLVGVHGGTIRNCYSTGKVVAFQIFGGLIGSFVGNGTISSCFWDINTSGLSSSAGGTGKTTAQMKTLSTFTGAGWDFVSETVNGTADVWRMCEDWVGYPRLSWEFAGGGDFACPDGVSFEDLMYLSERWMTTTPAGIGAADSNGDGGITLEDFANLSEHWFTIIPQPTFVGHWKLDGDYADSANGYSGTPRGDPAFVGTEQAKVGTGAVELDGNDYIVVNGLTGIMGAQARTCVAWIKTTSTVAPIVYWGDKDTAGGTWDMRVNAAGQLRVQVAGTGGINSVSRVNTGQWVHVAAILPEGASSTADVLLYINGVLETGGAVTAGMINTKALAAMRIGADEAAHYFTGLIDDVRIYDLALTAEEIAAMMGD